jgi:hypothetical protein
VAAEAAWYALGAVKSGYQPQVARQGDITHWWLRGSEGIVDPTAAQFPEGFNYATGRGCGFLTKGISARAATVLARAMPQLALLSSDVGDSNTSKRVRAYRNLHTGTWSVADTRTGLVIDHPRSLLVCDATFVVRPGGRAKVLASGRKNVHAFVVGTLVGRHSAPPTCVKVAQVTYNPRLTDSFMSHKPGDPRHQSVAEHADFVWLDEHSRVLAADC